MERHLRRLRGRPDSEQEERRDEQARLTERGSHRLGVSDEGAVGADELERRLPDGVGRERVQEEETDEHEQAAGDGDEHRFPGGVQRTRVVAVVPDEQERGDAREFPEQEERDEVRSEGHTEHRAHERQQGGVVLHLARLAVHVAPGVGEDQHADAGGEQADEQREAVDVQRERDVVGWDPRDGDGPLRAELARDEAETGQCHERSEVRCPFAENPIDERDSGRTEERKRQNGEQRRRCRLHVRGSRRTRLNASQMASHVVP